MTERMTREQALERATHIDFPHTRWCGKGCVHREATDLILAVQSETEQRVMEKCCEIAGNYKTNSGAAIKQSIRAAFAAAERKQQEGQ